MELTLLGEKKIVENSYFIARLKKMLSENGT